MLYKRIKKEALRVCALLFAAVLAIPAAAAAPAVSAASSDGSGEVAPKNVVKGIVEENNPQLGYITLYNEDGTRNAAAGESTASFLRTYYYINPNEIEVVKNRDRADIDDIEAGNTAFLKVDGSGNVLAVSAADNYTVRYARVLSKSALRLVVEYEGGPQQTLELDDDILVISGRKVAGLGELKDGDRIRMLLHIADRLVRIKEIHIEGDEHFIANIYKGRVVSLDRLSNKLVVENLKAFYKGQWRRTDRRGFSGITLADGCSLYVNQRKLKAGSVNSRFNDCEAYIAVEKDYGGEELAVFVSFRNENDAEVIYDDSVAATSPLKGSFSLSGSYSDIRFGPGSIVIKEGRLVPGSSISSEDNAYVVANRDYGSGKYSAGIVVAEERVSSGFVQIYRARIKQITEGEDFTVESFSQLKGTSWEFSNTPKTFKIGSDTRILDDTGITGQQDFKGYGEDSFIGRTVYILAEDIRAALVSTAPYGTYHVKGEIYELQSSGSGGSPGKPAGIFLRKVRMYDPADYMWKDAKDITLNILHNSIILKNSRIVSPGDLRPGDRIRVIKKESGETGDACILIVEE